MGETDMGAVEKADETLMGSTLIAEVEVGVDLTTSTSTGAV